MNAGDPLFDHALGEREMSVMLRFVIPNRDDPEKPPTLYEYWGAQTVPREGETVYLSGTPWVVKWVAHTFQVEDRNESPPHRIDVRLIEPDHWTQR
jgi:hypothetical protein